MNPADLILKHYRRVGASAQQKPPLLLSIPVTLTNVCQGLGDSVILTDVINYTKGTYPVYSNSPLFYQLTKLIKWKLPHSTSFLVDAPNVIKEYATGNGHFIQRLRRAYGFPVADLPQGYVGDFKRVRQKPVVILHFNPGSHVTWQKQYVHPHARELYPSTKDALVNLIKERPDLHFVNIGKEPIPGAELYADYTIEMLVRIIARATYFIGIMSGPLHVAAALNIKTIAIVNFPSANKIYLPTLVSTGQVEEEWFYPQNVHMHQEESTNPLVPQVTLKTLHQALNGEIYPHWQHKHLHLIYEKL